MDAVEGKKEFDFDATLQKCVSDIEAAEKVDLLPSSPNLFEFPHKLAMIPAGKLHAMYPTEIL